MISAKENFLRAVKFSEPEYVPNSFTAPTARVSYYGANPEDIAPGTEPVKEGRRTVWRDIWGTGWERVEGAEGVMPLYKTYPLAELKDWEDYVWPDPRSEMVIGRIAKNAEKVDRERFLLVGSHRSTIIERCWKLVGMANMIKMIYSDSNRAKWLFSELIDFGLKIAEEYVRVGIDMAALGDDWGWQRGPLMPPEIFVKYVKPQYKRLIDFYKEHGILIHFHSCGCIQDIIDHFVDLKIDVLNPIQATANNLDLIRDKTQGKMALEGGVSSGTLMHKEPEEIVKEVRQRLRQLGEKGGYIIGPDQGLPFPTRNVVALIKTTEIYGKYPLPY